MGPLFSMALMAIAAGIVFSVVVLVLRVLLSASVAVSAAIGFVIGAGTGAALAIGLFALTMGAGTLQSGTAVLISLATLAVSGILGGTALSWQVVRRFRTR